MEYSEIKAVKLFCDGLFSSPDWREVVQNVLDGEDDFEVDNVRFIADDVIDKIQTASAGQAFLKKYFCRDMLTHQG